MPTPRVYREYKNLRELNIGGMRHQKLLHRQFSEEERRGIVIMDLTSGLVTQTTILDTVGIADFQCVVGYFAHRLLGPPSSQRVRRPLWQSEGVRPGRAVSTGLLSWKTPIRGGICPRSRRHGPSWRASRRQSMRSPCGRRVTRRSEIGSSNLTLSRLKIRDF